MHINFNTSNVTDLTKNVTNMLTAYLKHLKIDIIFYKESICLEEIFLCHSFLPLFLLEQQDNIDHYLKKKNNLNTSIIPKYIKVEFIKKDETYFGVYVDIKNNLSKKEEYDCACYIVKSILDNKVLNLKENKIELDYLCKIYENKINEIFVLDTPNIYNTNISLQDKKNEINLNSDYNYNKVQNNLGADVFNKDTEEFIYIVKELDKLFGA